MLLPSPPLLSTAEDGVVAGDGEVTLRFLPPANIDLIPPVTSYTVVSDPDGRSATVSVVTAAPTAVATAPPSGTLGPSLQQITLPGLTNGVMYTFTVYASNSLGDGAPSLPSRATVPGNVLPGAPVVGGARSFAVGAVAVTFTPPPVSGASPVLSYDVTASPGGRMASGAASPIVISGLRTDVAYTFTVQARNAAGVGAPSLSTNSVFPVGVAPTSPLLVSATAGNAAATVVFEADPRAALEAVTAADGTVMLPGATSSTVLTSPMSLSLSSPRSLTFLNGFIPRAESTSDAAATMTSSPSSSGVKYVVTAMPGGATGEGTQSPVTVNGLANDEAYTFTVKAGRYRRITVSCSVIPLSSLLNLS